MSDEFTGNWLVTEYVHNPDGVFAGIVHQKRHVETVDEYTLRVIQDCYPSEALNNHPMAGFRGHWEFDVVKTGNQRQYHGEDVVGTGYSWFDNVMTGQGIWPRFGYNFTSFGVVTRPDRQLTGGTFMTANETMCKIIGIAVPERADAPEQWATLDQDQLPTSTRWHGTLQKFDVGTTTTTTMDTKLTVDEGGHIAIGAGETAPYQKTIRYGCMQETVAYTPQGERTETSAIYDTDNKTLIILRLIYRHLALNQVMSGVFKRYNQANV